MSESIGLYLYNSKDLQGDQMPSFLEPWNELSGGFVLKAYRKNKLKDFLFFQFEKGSPFSSFCVFDSSLSKDQRGFIEQKLSTAKQVQLVADTSLTDVAKVLNLDLKSQVVSKQTIDNSYYFSAPNQ